MTKSWKTYVVQWQDKNGLHTKTFESGPEAAGWYHCLQYLGHFPLFITEGE